ncbi:MAG TPA: formate dehydrogenase subunit gamma [Rhodoblastus sp.]|nr:formate dehydrogenase subunit gamma [Rhodoblastus sp.]
MDNQVRDDGKIVTIPRYSGFQRVNHWITAILFILLALSGLSLAFPSLFFLSALFGGGAAARAIHPWLGLALVVSFFWLAAGLVSRNIIHGDDITWLRNIRRVLANEHEGLPELGKYNLGQKGVYWSQALLILILLGSGLAIWQEYFGGATSIPMQRFAASIHSLAAMIAIAIIFIHVYAAFWTKGTLRAMTRGTVTGGWAYVHHRKWLKEMLGRDSAAAAPAPRARRE